MSLVVLPAPDNDLAGSLRAHVRVGLVICAALLIGMIGWSAVAQLSGAVVTHGQLVVESSAKKIQHPTGGVVATIRVREGDRVSAGDVLLRLDDTQTRANLAMVSQSLDELRSRKARLEAERDGAAAVVFPAGLEERAGQGGEVARTLAGERTLFEARRSAREGQKSQLHQRIEQLNQDIQGLSAQQDSKVKEMGLVRSELEGVQQLYAKKLVPLTRINALEREAARLDGERGALVSSAAEAKGKVAEIELQIIQIDQDLRTDVLRDLRETDARIDELVQKEVAAKDQLARIELRSPQDGVVAALAVHTIGGVVAPGETLMQVVPDHDKLIIEARVAPQDIDQISAGQTAFVRMSAFNQRTTPELFGKVRTVSADLMRDPQPALGAEQAYYVARVELPDEEVARLRGLKLVPGMPVEVHLQTDSRSALSYFLRPLADQFNRAFREQ
jgi:HlyD family secretion protein